MSIRIIIIHRISSFTDHFERSNFGVSRARIIFDFVISHRLSVRDRKAKVPFGILTVIAYCGFLQIAMASDLIRAPIRDFKSS